MMPSGDDAGPTGGGTAVGPDAGVDAGAIGDAGSPGDAGGLDAGGIDAATPDAGAPDSGLAIDAGATSDAGFSVIETGGSCDAGAGATCHVVQVNCGTQAPLEASLREYPANGNVPFRGTIVLGSGGTGTEFYAAKPRELGLISDLNAAGFHVVDRAWHGQYGWFAGTGGPAAVACRMTALLNYERSVHATGALCATESSGGSVELIYALTRNHADAVLDLAVPSSGPFHRLDLACGLSDPAWTTECHSLLTRWCPTCDASGCGAGAPPEIRTVLEQSFSGTVSCQSTASPQQANLLRAESPISATASTTFAHTQVEFVLGHDDPSGLPAFAMATEAALRDAGTSTALYVENNTAHNVPGSANGVARLLSVLTTQCIPRH